MINCLLEQICKPMISIHIDMSIMLRHGQGVLDMTIFQSLGTRTHLCMYISSEYLYLWFVIWGMVPVHLMNDLSLARWFTK